MLLAKVKIRIPNISLKGAVLGTFIIGFVYSFSIGGILNFRSWTLNPLIDFDNGVRIISPLIETDPDDVSVGDEVVLKVVDAPRDRVLFLDCRQSRDRTLPFHL